MRCLTHCSGVWVITATISLLMLVTTVLFAAGLLGQRVVCEPLRQPQQNPLFALVDQMVDLSSLNNITNGVGLPDELKPDEHTASPANVSSLIA